MKWVLVLVGLMNGQTIAQNEGVYNQMDECFAAREQYVWETFGNTNGQTPINFQVVCIRSDKY